MNKTTLCKKPHDIRKDYIQCNEICVMCDVLNRNGSKIFGSSYALRYHITTEHDLQDEIESGITRKEILKIIRCITTALEWNMLVDLPKDKS